MSLRYAFSPSLNAYATYSRGFKSGVFNANQLQAASVKPESVDAFEIGMKGSASRAFSFDIAGYYYKYKNLQFSSFGATATQVILRNAAAAEIYETLHYAASGLSRSSLERSIGSELLADVRHRTARQLLHNHVL